MVSQANTESGQRALVTGGANGIGWETCRRLAACGYRVALADIDGAAASARVAELGPGHAALAVDLTDRVAASGLAARAADALGGLDVIVNNAGVTDTSGRPIVSLPDAAFQRLVDLNLLAVDAICASAGDVLPRGSRVVNLASGASFRPLALRGPYSATKAGIVALTQAYADLLAPHGISVSAVAPGYTRTPLVDALHREGRVDLDKVAASIPIGRLAMPDDIASVIAFAASHDGRVLSGETVQVDGAGLSGPAPAGASPARGVAADGRIAVIGAGDVFSAGAQDDIVRLSGASALSEQGPLRAVIDLSALGRSDGAGETLSRVRDTASACAELAARTEDFSLLYVFGEGQGARRMAAVAAGEMLARTIALEWAPGGLRVNALRWRSAAQDGLDALCRFLVGGGAAMITGQALQAGARELAANKD